MRFSTPRHARWGSSRSRPRPAPSAPSKQNGQWSVETTCRSLVRSPRHSASWCLARGRSGVRASRTWRPRSPGSARLSVDRNRYCGQVSPNTGQPAVARLGQLGDGLGSARHVHDVQRDCRPPGRAGSRGAWPRPPAARLPRPRRDTRGRCRPAASACCTSTSIAMPFSACIIGRPPLLARPLHAPAGCCAVVAVEARPGRP